MTVLHVMLYFAVTVVIAAVVLEDHIVELTEDDEVSERTGKTHPYAYVMLDFLPRCMESRCGLAMRILSVYLSVCGTCEL